MNPRARFVTFDARAFSVLALAALIAAPACSSAPPDAPPSIEGTRIGTTRVSGLGQNITSHDTDAEKTTVTASADNVWGVLGGVYEQIGIPVTTTDAYTMTIGNGGFEARRIDGSRMNNFLDCGTNFGGPLANLYEVTLAVSTRLSEVDGNRTEIATAVAASAKPRTNAGYPVQCTTREKLEELIVEKVSEALGLKF